jgi:hypothetical protein
MGNSYHLRQQLLLLGLYQRLALHLSLHLYLLLERLNSMLLMRLLLLFFSLQLHLLLVSDTQPKYRYLFI